MPDKKLVLFLNIDSLLDQFRRHDPKGLVVKNCDLISLAWPYTHEWWEDELPYENAKDWDEV
jgi:hypothetical protein